MLGRVRKRKKIDSHELQSLRNVVKRGGDTIVKDFENTFQELVVEGKRKKASVVNYTKLSSGKKEELETLYQLIDRNASGKKEELETLYMGTPSEAQRQFQRSRPFSRGQSLDRQRSQSQDSCFPRQSRFDHYKSGGD